MQCDKCVQTLYKPQKHITHLTDFVVKNTWLEMNEYQNTLGDLPPPAIDSQQPQAQFWL